MKPAPFDYVAPGSVEEALDQLEQGGGDAVVLAGGQTLLPLLALRLSTPSVVVDVNRIPALAGVAATTQGLRVGAVTRQKQILSDETVAERLPLLAEAVRHVGHVQTRARGTVGGSVATGEPAAELPATALALGASLEVRSAGGARTVDIEDLYLGPYATSLEPGELVTAVHFPAPPAGAVPVFRELARRPGDFAMVGLIGFVARQQGKVSQARFAWFGMGPMPLRARQAEAALIGLTDREIDPKALAELAIADADPLDDHLATADYRRLVGRRVFADVMKRVAEGAMAA